MQYGEFADIYDRLMHKSFNYAHICDYIENIFDMYDVNPEIVCDLACGTGNVTGELARRGYSMIGVDISPEMLNIAREKASDAGQDILYLNQDITKLDLFGSAGAFLCMTDGINYILNPKKTEYLFKRIRTCFIDNGGVLIFDISTKNKLENTIGNNTFIYDTDDIFYTWENKYSKKMKLSNMELTFFKKEKNGLYSRFYEHHIQRAYEACELRDALKRAGFSSVDIYAEQSFEQPSENEQRIVIVAKA